MRYAISNWIYNDESLRETFYRLAKFGYDNIELVGEPTQYTSSELSILSDEFGIYVSSVLGWCIWGISGRDLASPIRDERVTALRYCEECIEFTSALGARIFVLLPAPAGRVSPIGEPKTEFDWSIAYQTEWEIAVDSVAHLTEYAASRNVIIALEPVNRYESFLITNLDQALKFLTAVNVPNLMIHLDTFHMNIEEADIPSAIRRAGPLLVNIHISDSNRKTPGCGHIDFQSILIALHEINYQGVLVLEPVPPGSNPLLASKMESNLSLRDYYSENGISYLKSLEQCIASNSCIGKD
jgi:sugar phosphate isomerase/epimerase